MKNKRFIKAFTVLLIFACLTIFSFSAYAEEETPIPTLSANDLEVTAGNNVTVYIRADNFVNVGAVDIYAFYDSSVFSLSSTSAQGMANGAQTAIKTDISGEACFSAVAPNGMNGSGYIWSITFKVKDNATEGNYRVIFAAGDAYDLTHIPINISSGNCSIKVNPAVQTVIKKKVNVYSSGGYGQYKKGDKIQLDYYTSSANGLCAANFLLKYDADHLLPESMVLNDRLKNTMGALCSYNDNAAGYRRLAYASLEGLSGYVQLLSVTFTVVADIDSSVSTDVVLEVSGLYDSSLATMTGMEVTNKIQLYAEQVDTRPVISLSEFSVNDNLLVLQVTAPGSTNLAAGDFVVKFDPSAWICIAAESGSNDCMIVSNIKQNEGKVTFSFISENGISSDAILAFLIFENVKCSSFSTKFDFSGKNLVNSTFKKIDATYNDQIMTVIHQYSVNVTKPTCTENGFTTHTCKSCKYAYTDNEVKKLGHDLTQVLAKPATCTEIGWNTYEKCSRCAYTTYVEIPALKHDLTQVPAKPATCTEIGWNAYEKCSRCAHTTYVEIPALKHDLTQVPAKPATCTEIGWNAYEKCSRCDYTTYVEMPALKHDLTQVPAKAATCTEIGWNAYEKCSRCDYTTYVEIPALKHDLTQVPAKSATCTGIGWNTYEKCSRCTYTTYVEIPALKHDLTQVPAKPATCTEIGWNAYEKCSRCDYTTYVEIHALKHDLTQVPAKAATCAEIGWNAYEKCSRCSYSTYVEIPALEHDLTQVPAKAATCTEIGWNTYEKCSRCAYTTYVEIPALKHDLTQVPAKAATCTEIGWNAYEKCSRCSYSTYVEMPTIEHTYTSVVVKPQFGVQGYTLYTCTDCGHSYKDNYTDPLSYLPGDIDNNGVVEKADAQALLKYITGNDVSVVEEALDVNRDGNVNIRDTATILLYLNGKISALN